MYHQPPSSPSSTPPTTPLQRSSSSGLDRFLSNAPDSEADLLPPSSLRALGGRRDSSGSLLNPTLVGVQNGLVGAGYDRFPTRNSTYSMSGMNSRHSQAFSDVAIDILPYSPMERDSSRDSFLPTKEDFRAVRKEMNDEYLWNERNAEVDDYLHEPNPDVDRILDKQKTFGWENLLNSVSLAVVVIVIVGLFAGWPIYRFAIVGGFPDAGTLANLGFNVGGINGSGQIPDINAPDLWDIDTPVSAQSRVGFDGDTYNLVFSDEFNVDGRTFWPGDDPYWEAVNLHYWATQDAEWYDPDAIITKNGNLEITLSEEPINNLSFRSGMLQSWNKFCFTGGYIEMNMSLPGTPFAQAYWPGAWTMGNLGRAGYGATNLGVWPYSYNECDVGTLPNQTWVNGTGPDAAKHSGSHDYGGELSWLPGQRLSACTCPGEDHPGPNVNVGRGAPEIDLIEAKIASNGKDGLASQSIQIAPIDAAYAWKNTTPYIQIWDTTKTILNTWTGGIDQESMSADTVTDTTSYEGNGWSTFGFEYEPGGDGRITWTINGTQSWQLNANAMGPNPLTQIGQRLVSQEPMSIVLNLAISNAFQEVEWGKAVFPGTFRIDYVRIYQKTRNIGCDPKDYPTSDYINRHPEAYLNPLWTSWKDIPGDNYTLPKNSLGAEGCS